MKCIFGVNPAVNGQGEVKFSWQKSVGNYLAITGANKVVNIFGRHGHHKSDTVIVLPGICTYLDWYKDGDVLSITQEASGILFLWNAHNHQVMKLDTGMKENLSLCLWAKNSHLLAIGTSRGNLVLYNHRTRRKVPVLGKHTKMITCGAWNSQNLLALGADDKMLSLSNAEGDTIKQIALRAEPSDIQFSPNNMDTNSTEESVVSVVVGHKTLFLMEVDNTDTPVELAFQPRYGEIVAYKWFSDGHIMVGFTLGFFIVISTCKEEIGQEMFQSHNHKNFLSDVALSTTLNQAGSCGDNSVKIHDLNELKEVYTILNVEEEKGTLHRLQWTDDGQLLTVSTLTGGVYTYLANLPMLGDTYGTRLAHLTSLLEVTIVNNVEEEPPITLQVSVEPSFIYLGPFHVAMGVNDRVWFHEISEHGEVTEKLYLGSVGAIKMNEFYAAVLYDGKVHLHLIDSDMDITKDTISQGSETRGDREGRLFPEEGREGIVSCLNITQDFLIYATESGSLIFFHLEDWQVVNEFKHVVGISKVYSDSHGTKLVIIDEKSDAFIYSPLNDSLVELHDFPPSAKGVLWENWPLDKHILVVYDGENVYTYVYLRDTLDGPQCEMVGSTKLPFGHHPLMLYNGEVSCQTKTGKISILKLSTHNFSESLQIPPDELQASFHKFITLRRLRDAWTVAVAMDNKDAWTELARAALKHLDIDTAIRVYKQIKDIAMVVSLQEVQTTEDRNLLVGHIAMTLGSYKKAQELFLNSSHPVAALNMRRDLLHWDQALQLAKSISPEQIPYISKEYAHQLEFTGDFGNALLHYERGITHKTKDMEHDAVCTGGIARMVLRTGDIRRGISLAQSMESRQLKKECASILEGLKLYPEAAVLYEESQCWDKATAAYMKSKNWKKAGDLLQRVTSPKLHGQYAKAREADGHFKEAARAYESAKDYDHAVRVYLEQLNSLDDAVRIVRESQSLEGAKMIANFFQKLGDVGSALQFLVLSKRQDEAFQMAESYNYMEKYAEVIGEDASVEDYMRIAKHFKKTNQHFKAGQFFYRGGNYEKALSHLLLCSTSACSDGENIDLAIKVVGEANQETLTQQLMDFLMGGDDSTPKDAKYLFRLHLALKQYHEAARTASLIAREDQTAGNYRNAHDVLFYMYSELKKHDIKIPSDMTFNLMILHSYIIVKTHVKMGDHVKAARMLIRVANNISKFPSHIVPILTSAVIECHRSGLRNSAFTYAAMLIKPEYRQKIDPKWKKKIEQIVRKPDKSEVEDDLSPCPYCDHPLPQSKLDCPLCKNNIPYCIVTGFHIVKGNWTKCPTCNFPALHSEFLRLLKSSTEATCPMCSNSVAPDELIKLETTSTLLSSND